MQAFFGGEARSEEITALIARRGPSNVIQVKNDTTFGRRETHRNKSGGNRRMSAL
jgi:hypothetical protein